MAENQAESADIDDVRDLLNQHGVIETYSGLLGAVIRCRTCGEITGGTPLDALRRHDLAVLDANRLLSLPPGEQASR